jgi:hypothetical protein
MKKVSVMVVAALLSASMFANSASIPKNKTTVNGTKQKTEVGKDHKQKDKKKEQKKGGTTKVATPKTREQKMAQKSPKEVNATK